MSNNTAAEISPTLAFRAVVRRIEERGAGLRRLVLGGEDLAHLGLIGLDGEQEGEYLDLRFKLLVPTGGATVDSVAEALAWLRPSARPTPAQVDGWYREWLTVPEASRGAMRTYTMRWVREEDGERRAAVDLVLHGVGPDGVPGAGCGPAAAFAAGARVGDEIVLLAPNRALTGPDYGGIDFRPGAATHVLLAADETAAPALCNILSALPRSMRGQALIEVPEAGQVQDVDAPEGIDVQWLVRTPEQTHGDVLAPALEEAALAWIDACPTATSLRRGEEPEDVDVDAGILWETGTEVTGEGYAWIAGEAGMVKGLRRHLVRDLGVDRKRIAFMGYWRTGRAEG